MQPTQPPAKHRLNETKTTTLSRRGYCLVLGSSIGSPLIAGCSTQTKLNGLGGGSTTPGDSSGPSGSFDDTSGNAGTFRLLISDQPVAIGEFDELNISLARARIFRDGGAGTDVSDGEAIDTPSTATPETATKTESDTATKTETETPTSPATEKESEAEEEEPDDGDRQGFFTLDLGGATVDLTQVVGDKAIGVFDGELQEGRYTKIELYAASVEGIVDEEPVRVMIPSGKLQIVKPFDVVAGETLSFVFDINVVKKGQTGEYNLLPVISESGVAGQDVEMNEIGGGRNGNAESDRAKRSETEKKKTEEPNREGQNGTGSVTGESENQPDDAEGRNA